MGLRPLACWGYYEFESRQGHRCLALVIVVCCQVVDPATRRSLVQWSPTECDESECDSEVSTMRRPRPIGLSSHEKKKRIGRLWYYLGTLHKYWFLYTTRVRFRRSDLCYDALSFKTRFGTRSVMISDTALSSSEIPCLKLYHLTYSHK